MMKGSPIEVTRDQFGHAFTDRQVRTVRGLALVYCGLCAATSVILLQLAVHQRKPSGAELLTVPPAVHHPAGGISSERAAAGAPR